MKRKEILRFFIAGGAAVFTDLSIYFLLKNISFSANLSKGISFICGTLVAYVLNKYWTFEINEKSMKEILRFISLYSITLFINVIVNKYMLMIFPGLFLFSFLCSTGTSTILNFAGQKWWVFKETELPK